jgi:hypothetical protein
MGQTVTILAGTTIRCPLEHLKVIVSAANFASERGTILVFSSDIAGPSLT